MSYFSLWAFLLLYTQILKHYSEYAFTLYYNTWLVIFSVDVVFTFLNVH